MQKISELLNMKEIEERCPVHHEKLFLIFGRKQCKQCAFDLIQRDKEQDKKQQHEQRLARLLEIAHLPKRHQSCGFKNYERHDHARQKAFEIATAYAKSVMTGTEQNLVMVGRTGTGKTHLACAIARNLLQHNKHVRYITTADLAENIMQAWREDDKTQKGEIAKFADYDVLILDEYGLHDQHEKRLEIIHQVLYARYDNMKPSIVISNMTIEQLQQNLGDRLWSRLQHGGLQLIDANWGDYRRAVT